MGQTQADRMWREYMRKIWWSVCLILLLALGTAACGGGTAVSVDGEKLAAELQAAVDFKDDMSEVETSVFYALYNLSEDDVTQAVMIGSTGATAEEIAVIEAASQDSLETVKKAVQERIEFQRDGFENYVPEELSKLSNPVVEVIGNNVIVCISDDNEKAREVIEGYRAK